MDIIQQGHDNLRQGGITEASILFALTKHGFEVLVPWNHYSRFDFVVYKDNKFTKIQCKSGTLKNNIISFRPYSTTKKQGKWTRENYKDDVDFFFVYCKQTEKIYFVNVANCGGSRKINFFINSANKFAKKADDFEFKGTI